MKKRNGLIELYRLFFALNVVKSHGFFPEGIDYFSPGRVSVEFFFVLSGYLFLRTLERLRDEPMGVGIVKLIKSKLAPIFIPLVIGLVSNIVCNIVTGDYFASIGGYLWYVNDMLVIFIAYFIVRKLVRSESAFGYIVLGVFAAATLMRFSGIFYTWGYVRAAASISLGMLLAKLPEKSSRGRECYGLRSRPCRLPASL